MGSLIYPQRGHIYSLVQIETGLKLRDSAYLGFYHTPPDGGEPRNSVIQTSHCTVEQLLDSPLRNSLWRYERETSEWIPVFSYAGNEPITKFVDMEPDIDPLRRPGEVQGWWVTPKGLPREQNYGDKASMDRFIELMGWPATRTYEVEAVNAQGVTVCQVVEASCRDWARKQIADEGHRIIEVRAL